MNLSQLMGEEKRFLSRLEDLFSLSQKTQQTRFSAFLDERQIDIAREYILQSGQNDYSFYGGFEGAVRQVLGVFPRYVPTDAKGFPIVSVAAKYPSFANVTHRDFLGSLMSLKITRDSVGDILAGEGSCTFFLLACVAPVVLDELCKVGGVGVRCEVVENVQIELHQEFLPMRGTVHSLRIDSLVGLLTGLSREKKRGAVPRGTGF